jgi:hypothetical protein
LDETFDIPTSGGRRWTSGARWLVLAAAALLFTLIQVRFSFDQYRLAQAPFYDDVVYFCDALARLDVLYNQGCAPMLRTFIAIPAHSPYSTIMALLGFLIFGIKDWAPYMMNCLLVLALLACVDYLMRGTKIWQRLLVCLIVLCIPLSGIMVLDCRPDLAWGLAAAMAVLLPLRGPFVGAPRRYQLAAGIWCAAALICKPTICPLTLFSVGIAWIAATICDRLADPEHFSFKRVRTAWLFAILPVVVLASPVYFNARDILDYIHLSLHGPGPNFWGSPKTTSAKILFYVSGFAGDQMFHHQLHLILIVLALGAIVVIWRAIRDGNPARVRLYRMIALGLICFITWLIPTLLDVANPFFGTQFQTLMILGMVLVLRMLLIHAKGLASKGFAIAFLLLCTWGAIQNASFVVPWRVPSALARNNAKVLHDVEQVLLHHAATDDHVFFTATGWLNCRTMQYVLRQDGTMVQTTDSAFSVDPKLLWARMNWADFIIASDSGVTEFDTRQPGLPFDQSLQLARQRKDFVQIAAVPCETGKRFFIFQRTRPLLPQDLTE